MDSPGQDPASSADEAHTGPLLDATVNDRRAGGSDGRFGAALARAGLPRLRARAPRVLQMNLGYRCNQRCSHCHVEAGPHRDEVMSREVMAACLEFWDRGSFEVADVTGGAPEMNPHLPWLLDELGRRGAPTIVRTNLTVLTAGHPYRRIVRHFVRHRVQLVASLPCYTASNTDAVRGDGVFHRSIEALRLLNGVGYGLDPALELVLVYHPAGPSLPPPASALEDGYRRQLRDLHDVHFTRLITMSNLPVGRFADRLRARKTLDAYLDDLERRFNPAAAEAVMCRTTLSVGWDGTLYDCDFNQALGLPSQGVDPPNVTRQRPHRLADRPIVVGPHCLGCTAGAGSSCQGATVSP